MHQLVLQLIEPSVIDDPWTADVWLFSDKMVFIVSEQSLAMADIDAWVQEQLNANHSERLVDLIAFAPASRGHARLLTISKGQERYISDIAPTLMESFLAQPIEDIHFVTKVVDSNGVWVSAVDREYMVQLSQIVDMVTAVKKRLLLPQSLLYKRFDAEEFVSFMGTDYRFLNDHLFPIPHSFAAQSATAPSKVLDEDFLRQSLLDMKSWQGVNLFEREFAQQSSSQKFARFWKIGGFLSAVLLAGSCTWLHYEASVYQQQATFIENKANKAFLTLAPEEGRVVNLKRQIEGRLRSNESQEKVDDQDYSPYFVLKKIEQAKQDIKEQNELQLIAFRDGVYILEWAAADQDTLAKISKSFARFKLDAYLDQVVREDKLYVGSYRIQGML
ncbi:hypothetical protein [Marinomonas transparens]|uniref:Type II secretion system protein L n=1 Tax=Marinomonas transparens TaxID=2795388 RepID=A0A934JS81_9GAMM|nr:hypothetical protein [Marinomonas transparens]MBJ7539054.1 hypothetical protein [Marinomonas transparens]